jgi:hypothetical protein
MAINIQNINLEKSRTYMVIFDEPVENYTLTDDKSLKVELLNTLVEDKTQMLLTSLDNKNSSLTVKTSSNTYRLDIFMQTDDANTNVLSNMQDDKNLKIMLGDIPLDFPPVPQNTGLFRFSLDTPPEMR